MMEFLNVNRYYSVPAHSVQTDPVQFGGQSFLLLWSMHARKRTTVRGSSDVELADHFLRFAILRAEEKLKKHLAKIDGYCTIFDRLSGVFAVLSVNREKGKIYVVSYGDSSKMYPRYGDTVIQGNEAGQIRILRWKERKREPICTDIYCHLNGKTLNMCLTRWTVRVFSDSETRKDKEEELRAIADALSSEIKTIPEGQIINIWDWRTGAFISVILTAGSETLDVVLFQTVDFEPKKNQYARIDITEEGSKLQLAQ